MVEPVSASNAPQVHQGTAPALAIQRRKHLASRHVAKEFGKKAGPLIEKVKALGSEIPSNLWRLTQFGRNVSFGENVAVTALGGPAILLAPFKMLQIVRAAKGFLQSATPEKYARRTFKILTYVAGLGEAASSLHAILESVGAVAQETMAWIPFFSYVSVGIQVIGAGFDVATLVKNRKVDRAIKAAETTFPARLAALDRIRSQFRSLPQLNKVAEKLEPLKKQIPEDHKRIEDACGNLSSLVVSLDALASSQPSSKHRALKDLYILLKKANKDVSRAKTFSEKMEVLDHLRDELWEIPIENITKGTLFTDKQKELFLSLRSDLRSGIHEDLDVIIHAVKPLLGSTVSLRKTGEKEPLTPKQQKVRNVREALQRSRGQLRKAKTQLEQLDILNHLTVYLRTLQAEDMGLNELGFSDYQKALLRGFETKIKMLEKPYDDALCFASRLVHQELQRSSSSLDQKQKETLGTDVATLGASFMFKGTGRIVSKAFGLVQKLGDTLESLQKKYALNLAGATCLVERQQRIHHVTSLILPSLPSATDHSLQVDESVPEESESEPPVAEEPEWKKELHTGLQKLQQGVDRLSDDKHLKPLKDQLKSLMVLPDEPNPSDVEKSLQLLLDVRGRFEVSSADNKQLAAIRRLAKDQLFSLKHHGSISQFWMALEFLESDINDLPESVSKKKLMSAISKLRTANDDTTRGLIFLKVYQTLSEATETGEIPIAQEFLQRLRGWTSKLQQHREMVELSEGLEELCPGAHVGGEYQKVLVEAVRIANDGSMSYVQKQNDLGEKLQQLLKIQDSLKTKKKDFDVLKKYIINLRSPLKEVSQPTLTDPEAKKAFQKFCDAKISQIPDLKERVLALKKAEEEITKQKISRTSRKSKTNKRDFEALEKYVEDLKRAAEIFIDPVLTDHDAQQALMIFKAKNIDKISNSKKRAQVCDDVVKGLESELQPTNTVVKWMDKKAGRMVTLEKKIEGANFAIRNNTILRETYRSIANFLDANNTLKVAIQEDPSYLVFQEVFSRFSTVSEKAQAIETLMQRISDDASPSFEWASAFAAVKNKVDGDMLPLRDEYAKSASTIKTLRQRTNLKFGTKLAKLVSTILVIVGTIFSLIPGLQLLGVAFAIAGGVCSVLIGIGENVFINKNPFDPESRSTCEGWLDAARRKRKHLLEEKWRKLELRSKPTSESRLVEGVLTRLRLSAGTVEFSPT